MIADALRMDSKTILMDYLQEITAKGHRRWSHLAQGAYLTLILKSIWTLLEAEPDPSPLLYRQGGLLPGVKT